MMTQQEVERLRRLKMLDIAAENCAMNSPSGHMSKRARDAMNKRFTAMFNDPIFEPTEAEKLKAHKAELTSKIEGKRQAAKELRDLAARGIHKRKYPKVATEWEAQADLWEAELAKL